MPNWVTNVIEMDGIEKKDLFTDGELDFAKIIPEPTSEDECPKRYIRTEKDPIQIIEEKPWFNWYKWRISKWGTKWGASDTSRGKNFVEFTTVNSAISDELLIALSNMYPTQEIRYSWNNLDEGEFGSQVFCNEKEIN